MTPCPPVLVLAAGNPSRGDDALGPSFAEAVRVAYAEDVQAGRLEVLWDFQLNVEHALDLVGRRQVLFVDASLDAPAPYAFGSVAPAADRSFTSHALTPPAVLETYARVARDPPPPCALLAIRGERFELGEPLSAGARAHLDEALRFFGAWWSRRRDAG
ncbi:MAG: hydrogenase maturation protease [Myxococcota bacterium]